MTRRISSFYFHRSPAHTTTEARLAILGHFSAASLATGPLMSVPFISPSGVTRTAALSSKQILWPLTLRTAYFCRIMTAPQTWFLRSGGPLFTVHWMWSPTEADGYLASLVFARVTMMTFKVLAPVLSAQTMTAFRGMERVM